VDLLALIVPRIRNANLAIRVEAFLSNDLQALDDPGHHLMFQARVKTLRVLTHDDQVYIGIARRNMRQITDWPEVGI